MSDLLVIGAGPAGMAAAITASANGASVTVVDNRSEPGGNIYSCLKSTRSSRPKVWDALGSSYHSGQKLVDQFLSCDINYLPNHALWHLDPDGTASVRGPEGIKSFDNSKIILATGAQERPMPLEGWTLPGAMGVGAAQILLKSSGQLPIGPIIIVGQGPLPLLYAAQVLAVGGSIGAFVEPTVPRQIADYFQKMLGAWHGKTYLFKGLSYLMRRTLARIPVYRNAKEIRILGQEQVEGVEFRTNRIRQIPARSVLLHDGVVPNINPAAAGGLTLSRSEVQDCWFPVSNDLIKVAGDAGGILGAKSAELSGRKAVYESMGEPVPASIEYALEKERQFRSFIDAVYPTYGNAELATDPTIICRCEAVSMARIVSNIPECDTDPNRLKTNLRCGMGPCQGRMCALSIEAIISKTTGASKPEVGLHRLRNPIVPITLDDLATAQSENS